MGPHKPTPGPWHWRRDAYLVDADHNRIQVADLFGTRVGGMVAPSAEERTANGRLISAAPDLYAALCETEGALQTRIKKGEAGWAVLLQQVRAAIAKADGDAR